MEYIEELGVRAKAAEPVIISLKVSEKNAVLAEIAKRLRRDSESLIEANKLDI